MTNGRLSCTVYYDRLLCLNRLARSDISPCRARETGFLSHSWLFHKAGYILKIAQLISKAMATGAALMASCSLNACVHTVDSQVDMVTADYYPCALSVPASCSMRSEPSGRECAGWAPAGRLRAGTHGSSPRVSVSARKRSLHARSLASENESADSPAASQVPTHGSDRGASPSSPSSSSSSSAFRPSQPGREASGNSETPKEEEEASAGGPKGNVLLAVGSVAAGVALFLATRLGGGGVDLGTLAANSVAYDLALANGKSTLVEFYADWCEVCRESAGDVYSAEQQYKDKVNFVMLNIDNVKWAEELNEFGVEGIPHFAFLDGKGNEVGYVVGKLPKKVLEANLEALARGESVVPYSEVVGQFSTKGENMSAPPITNPRSHGQ